MKRYGFLAIWCDIGIDDLEDYRNWLTREHIADRTFSPGFLGVRLFEGLEEETSHFILYATEGPEVLQSPSYLAILNNPSPWTQRIMPRFGPFDRAAGEQAIKLGNGFGAFVVVSRIRTRDAEPDLVALRQALGRYMELPGVVSVRLMLVDKGSTGIESRERTMRAGAEGDFQFLLCVETLDEAAVRGAEKAVSLSIGEVFTGLDRYDMSSRRMIYGEAPYEKPTDRLAALHAFRA